MFKWLKNIIRGSDLQDQGFRRHGAGIIGGEHIEINREPDSGVVVDRDAIYGITGLKHAILLIANKVSVCRCHVIKEMPDGGREYAKDHNSYKLVRKRANPYLSCVELYRSLIVDSIWNGNGYAYYDHINNQSWLLDPSEVELLVAHQGVETRVLYKVSRPNFTHIYDSSEILHVRNGLCTSGGLVGRGLLDLCRAELGLCISEQKYVSAYFRHGGLSDVWIEVPEGSILPDEAYEQINRVLTNRYSGVDNHHKPLILGGGAKLNKTYLTAEDAALIAARQYSLIEVANMVGLPVSQINGIGAVGYNSLYADKERLLSDTLSPFVTGLENELSHKLLREDEKDEYTIEFDRSDLTKGDPLSEATLWKTRIESGQCSVEEYRKANNLPLANLKTDYFYVSSAVVPLIPPEPEPQAILAPDSPIPDDEIERGRDALTRSTLDRLLTRIKKDSPNNSNELITRHRDVFVESLPGASSFVDRFLDSLGAELDNVLPEQRPTVLAKLDTDKISEDVWS